MADVGTLEQVELDEALDWTPACEGLVLREAGVRVIDADCDQPAEWVAVSLCCTRTRFYCGEHRAARESFMASHPKAVHAPCGAVGSPTSWVPVRGGA